MFTRLSPNTVITLACSPIGGNEMKVALSCMILFKSAIAQMTIHSNLRGKIEASRDITVLFYEANENSVSDRSYADYPDFMNRDLEEHISCSLNAKKFPRNPDHIVIVTRRRDAGH